MPTPKEHLQERMLCFLEHLQPDGGGRLSGAMMPEFDYYALDYLDFAEMNLRRTSHLSQAREEENELISCVSNLKRALDCQIECFLCSWGLREEVNKSNLGLNKKLIFLTEIGLVSSRTIERFTTIRNKIEHDFQRPQIADLEALFDLVTAVVAILQMTTSFDRRVEFNLLFEEFEEFDRGLFRLSYDDEHLKFVATWQLYAQTKQDGRLEASFSSKSDFAYFFRVLLLLNQFDGFASYDHIRTRLNA